MTSTLHDELADAAAYALGSLDAAERERFETHLRTCKACAAEVDVYRQVTVPPAPERGEAIRTALVQGDVAELGRRLFNRLQAAAERLDSRIAEYYKRLAALAPAGQLMSGSGSSLFALCRSAGEAERCAAAWRDQAGGDPARVFAVRGCV